MHKQKPFLFSAITAFGTASSAGLYFATTNQFAKQTNLNTQAGYASVATPTNNFLLQTDNSLSINAATGVDSGYAFDLTQPFASGPDTTFCVTSYGGKQYLACFENNNNVK